MKALIIDISASPLREYVHQHGVADGLLYGCWYRIVRPLLVILTWVAFSLYIHHSLVTVGGTAAQIAELLVYTASGCEVDTTLRAKTGMRVDGYGLTQLKAFI